ncbi:uncharacterized protein LOC131606163 isoform X1 [Vicia villosa]|uniref:uncharacterized protein LOC131606163 isoform X1 n=1 Tax=Vicia villosa TaxID=3911 RepID=UPI00273C0E0D|nr:uncharacterized protein LOC131606163 isoform X1 [Vicia villosa]
MSHSEGVLLQQLFDYANQTPKSMASGGINDALGFLNAVRASLQPIEREKYQQFIKILRDFSAERINISDTIADLKTLFIGYTRLILEFNSFLPKKHHITVSSEDVRALGFLQEVELAFQYDGDNNFRHFLYLLEDYQNQTIDLSCFTSQGKVLLKNYPHLILKFNTFRPSQYRTGKKKLKDNGQAAQLPWDVLATICKTLDFDELFWFSGVCKNWRTFHKSNFVSSREPLLVHMTGNCPHSYSFISIPNQKVYDLNMMSSFQPPNCVYVRVSSGYFILAHKNNSFLLFNPFTMKEMVINATFTVEYMLSNRHEALLAFEKCSEEYVLVVLCKKSSRLHVYKSRHNGWCTYSTLKRKEVVVDFVVLNNMIYVVTNKARIGVLNLNSRNIQFLNLKNTPNNDSSTSINLVNCDEQLLVFHSISSNYRREVYKIDLSTMNYVKMKTLGDIALFYVSWGNCRALSNPNSSGYESNHVYEVSSMSQCIKYDWNDGRPSKIYPYLRSLKDYNLFDWCFRHVKYEVDYSLVE